MPIPWDVLFLSYIAVLWSTFSFVPQKMIPVTKHLKGPESYSRTD